MTLEDLFPGKMGRVELTRVALRLRRPDLLKLAPGHELDEETRVQLEAALTEVKKG